MYAVVETGGCQFTIEEGSLIKVQKLEGASGDKVTLDKVLLISDGANAEVGKPYIDHASVEAELVTQGKSEKVMTFKFKRRTKSRRTIGHRQNYTELKITRINTPH
jgi:large subunit ribosomal protein L21